MNYLDLFSGIGGFAYGAYMAGIKVNNHFYSEVEQYAIDLYKLRFPDSVCLGDITKIDFEKLKKDYPGEWVITGGFPCQDISIAGKGAGLDGKRSGLWFEYWRAIRILRPKYAIAENVSALTFRGLDRVLSSLAEIGYNAEWQDIRASDLGAPHRRERIWIVAYPKSTGARENVRGVRCLSNGHSEGIQDNKKLTYPNSERYIHGQIEKQSTKNRKYAQRDATSISKHFIENARCKYGEAWGEIARRLQGQFREWNACNKPERSMQTRTENKTRTGTTRMDDGVSSRVDRLKGCGNAIVPQIAKLLFELCENNINKGIDK